MLNKKWLSFFMGLAAAIGLSSAIFLIFEGTVGRALSLVLFLLLLGIQPLSSFRENITLSTFTLSALLTAGALTVTHGLFEYSEKLVFQTTFMTTISVVFGAALALLWLLAIRVKQPEVSQFMTRMLPGMLASAMIMGVLISLQFRYYRVQKQASVCPERTTRTITRVPVEQLDNAIRCRRTNGKEALFIHFQDDTAIITAPKN